MTDVPERLSETFAALAKAATPGPWGLGDGYSGHEGYHQTTYAFGVRTSAPCDFKQVVNIVAPLEQGAANGHFIAFCGTHREAIAEALALREDPRTARARRLLEMVEASTSVSVGGFTSSPVVLLARLDESEGTHE